MVRREARGSRHFACLCRKGVLVACRRTQVQVSELFGGFIGAFVPSFGKSNVVTHGVLAKNRRECLPVGCEPSTGDWQGFYASISLNLKRTK